MPHPDLCDDPVGAPEHAALLDDVLRTHLMSPQHETDHDAQCKGGSKRRDRPVRHSIRYDVAEAVLFPTKGAAEVAQRRLDLIRECFGRMLGSIEDVLSLGIEQPQ